MDSENVLASSSPSIQESIAQATTTESYTHYRPEKDFDLEWQREEEESNYDEDSAGEDINDEDYERIHREDIDAASQVLERKVLINSAGLWLFLLFLNLQFN